jgi:Fur family ferric uptake transcriptional regulator
VATHHHPHDDPPAGAPGPEEVEAQVAALVDRLRATGGRVTEARRAVRGVLVEAGSSHLSAEEIAERVRSSSPQVHLSTVYRTLESLEDAGLVRQARLGEGPTSHHLATDEHHHAVCDGCGAVIVLPAAALGPVVDRLARDHGFRADPRHVTIGGLCRDCAARPGRPQPGGGSDTRRR